MPRLPALRIQALIDLAEQLRFAPRAAVRRQVERAEALVPSLSDDQDYPADWLVFAITGFRPDMNAPSLVRGGVLRAELGPFIERLSALAHWTRRELGSPVWLDAAEVRAQLRVSVKTLERYRKRGLPARRVRGPRGRTMLVFKRTLVDLLAQRERAGLAGAAAFSRIDAQTAACMIRRAERYQRVLGWSRSRAAARIAARFGRSAEAVRQLLARASPVAAGARPRKRPIGPRARRVVDRAASRGVPLARIGEHFGRSPAAAHRALMLRRVEALRTADLARPPSIDEAIGGRDALIDELTQHPLASSGLCTPGALNLLEHLRQTLAAGWPDRATEQARARAACALRVRASGVLAAAGRRPLKASVLDRVETDLRWAARLVAELVRSQQMLVLRTIEVVFGRGVEDLAPALAVSALNAAIDACAMAALQFDPFRVHEGRGAATAGRLAAPTGLAINRALARVQAAHDATLATVVKGRATTIIRAITAADVALDDWTRRVAPWQRWLEPGARVRAAARAVTAAVDDPASRARALALQFGLPPAPRPHTRPEIMARLRVGALVLARWGLK